MTSLRYDGQIICSREHRLEMRGSNGARLEHEEGDEPNGSQMRPEQLDLSLFREFSFRVDIRHRRFVKSRDQKREGRRFARTVGCCRRTARDL
jgi:hypothetical protein